MILPPAPHRCARGGFALVIVLCIISLLLVVVLAFFSTTMTESATSVAYSDSVNVKQLADSALHLAQGQIRDATRGQTEGSAPETIAWASQPGMIRTFSTSGEAKDIYKLYSDDAMVVAARNFQPDYARLPADWKTGVNADIYTDLNAPQKDGTDRLVYPIVDPRAETGFVEKSSTPPTPGTPTAGVDGFKLTARPGYAADTDDSATNNPAPMPVRWIYILADGKMAAPTAIGTSVKVAGATKANPIVGRIAFWTDDETAKVNINTASEGVYWDSPRVYSAEDYGRFSGVKTISTPGMAVAQPAQREYQRYPGHPATTSLSPIFGGILPVQTPFTTTNATKLDPYYAIAPRIVSGGSKAGTAVPLAALTPDKDRLYASVDELIFTPTVATSGGRVPNTAAAGTVAPGVITREVMEKAKFFLTASSSAPETTLFNTPRIAMWPVNVSDTKRTAYDKLIAFCSTIGGKNYYFTRSNPRSQTEDYTGRNPELYSYLQALTARPEPGFGGIFLAKYPAGPNGITDRDQILTSIYDYIRCVNLADTSTGASPYTPVFDARDILGTGKFPAGAGEVIPIRIGATRGFGRFYTISEAALLFYGTNAAATGTDRMRAVFIMEFASPMHGLAGMASKLKYTVTGLENLTVGFGAAPTTFLPLGFAKNAGGTNGTNYIDTTDVQTNGGRSLGGTDGIAQGLTGAPDGQSNWSSAGKLLATPAGTTNFNYPFFTATELTFPPPTEKRFFLGAATIRVEIRPAEAADTSAPIQTLSFEFPKPANGFAIPGVVTKDFNSRQLNGFNAQAIIRETDTVVSLEPAGVLGSTATTEDPTAGDYRMYAALPDVPSTMFRPQRNYNDLRTDVEVRTAKGDYRHGLVFAIGNAFYNGVDNNNVLKNGTNGRLVPVPDLPHKPDITTVVIRIPDVPGWAGTQGVKRKDGGSGDWDTGLGDQKDGAYLNKPDEGDAGFVKFDGGARLPYMQGNLNQFSPASDTYFSPNRQMPSSMMLGSIPTGVQRMQPWQTLLFHPRPEDPTHPGRNSPHDHLIADLFWMPVVEPYAISQPFSTSGKVNLNYQIQPFTYIRRDTGVQAVMKSTKFLALQPKDGPSYKPLDAGDSPFTMPSRRHAINVTETLQQFDTKFANNEIFKSATQICEVNLVPKDGDPPYVNDDRNVTLANIKQFWLNHTLTGDNLREKPYADLYPRFTTKSNSYTVHISVQSLKKSPTTPADSWDSTRDRVTAEYRGSSLIERFIDVNDPTLPDFAKLAATNPTAAELNIDRYYRMRVVSTKRFNP
jgi:uncharacterized protein (TIGR02600 family)